MDPDRLLENERLQMQQIMELDMEELQVEEVDESSSSSDDDDFLARDSEVQGENGFTFDTCLASMHTYLGEVDDTHGKLAFLDGGAILNLPMFYLRGAVLFPEATLPLRVILPNSKAAIERALHQVDAPYTIGVTRVHLLSDVGKARFATTGTTAEIRQYRRLDDGSLNVVARGQQRFRLRRCWIDVEGVPCGEIQIVKEDSPLRTPKDAFAQLASVTDFRKCIGHPTKLSMFSPVELHKKRRADNDWESASGTSIDSDHSDMDLRISLPGTDSPHKCEKIQECSSSDEDFLHRLGQYSNRSLGSSHHTNMGNNYGLDLHVMESSPPETRFDGVKYGAMAGIRRLPRASLSFWPQWAYHMFDSYVLAHRAADLWKKIIRVPNLDDHIRKPDILSFHIGSKLPVSESTRQELLEIDGVSYRLRRRFSCLSLSITYAAKSAWL
ncbi:hypothetical protein HPP92_022672 [Vanilla planifolia]|uniref:Lon N-terminal domain-containing protein n=1 Tax=Vanilla planifolia TaxID=51239 RepID=A0A835PTP7_VANPL|nr:hypothetical protein HPP92_022672 [Vanilla planifolia]